MFVEKSGTIQRFHAVKKIGVILCLSVQSNGGPLRLFFHQTNIMQGPVIPSEGQRCFFKYDPERAVRPGWLPTAGAVRIVEETAETEESARSIVQSILTGQIGESSEAR